jgi:hypothetical protein
LIGCRLAGERVANGAELACCQLERGIQLSQPSRVKRSLISRSMLLNANVGNDDGLQCEMSRRASDGRADIRLRMIRVSYFGKRPAVATRAFAQRCCFRDTHELRAHVFCRRLGELRSIEDLLLAGRIMLLPLDRGRMLSAMACRHASFQHAVWSLTD